MFGLTLRRHSKQRLSPSLIWQRMRRKERRSSGLRNKCARRYLFLCEQRTAPSDTNARFGLMPLCMIVSIFGLFMHLIPIIKRPPYISLLKGNLSLVFLATRIIRICLPCKISADLDFSKTLSSPSIIQLSLFHMLVILSVFHRVPVMVRLAVISHMRSITADLPALRYLHSDLDFPGHLSPSLTPLVL